MGYVPNTEMFQWLKGKRVALVGSAASIEGTGHGPEIESHDVVVRVNYGAPVPGRLIRDAGHRTDILYHIIAYRNRRYLLPEEIKSFGAIKGRPLIVATRPLFSPRVAQFAGHANVLGIRWTTAGGVRGLLAVELKTHPNSGVVAFAHLRMAPLASLKLYGFDFYATGHWAGQGDETPAEAAAQAGATPGHNQEAHRAYVELKALGDARVKFSPEVLASLRP